MSIISHKPLIIGKALPVEPILHKVFVQSEFLHILLCLVVWIRVKQVQQRLFRGGEQDAQPVLGGLERGDAGDLIFGALFSFSAEMLYLYGNL